VLVNLARPAYIGVEQTADATLDSGRDELLRRYRESRGSWDGDFKKRQPRLTGLVVRENKRLASSRGLERAELLFDVKVDGAMFTFLARVLHDPEANRTYVLQAWSPRKAFAGAEAEMRQGLDSFRVLSRAKDD
jgi:hypothetical protein